MKMLLVLLLGCGLIQGSASDPGQDPPAVRASWRPLQPPHAGVRCWYTSSVGHGGVFCEPDPTATHGAGL
jgi:hypothetical protein